MGSGALGLAGFDFDDAADDEAFEATDCPPLAFNLSFAFDQNDRISGEYTNRFVGEAGMHREDTSSVLV